MSTDGRRCKEHDVELDRTSKARALPTTINPIGQDEPQKWQALFRCRVAGCMTEFWLPIRGEGGALIDVPTA
jgi:hypothetical protein